MADEFQGLSERAKLWIIAAGIILATACIFLALMDTHRISKELDYGNPDREVLENLYGMSKQNTSADPYLFVHTFNVQVLQKGIANRHALASLSIACGISLFAIGFSLFLIGADGVFKLQASSGAGPAVAVSGTAPGLLCFVAATILVGIGATRTHKIDIRSFRVPTPYSSYDAEQSAAPYTTSASTVSGLEDKFSD